MSIQLPHPTVRSFLITSGVLLCVAVGVRAQQGPPPAIVVTEPVRRETITQAVELIGDVAPIRDSRVASEVDGRVVSRPVENGDRVALGQELLRLDAKRLENELERVKAQLVDVEAQRELATIQERRARELFDKEILSPRELDESVATLRSLEGRADATRAAIAAIEIDLERSRIRAPFAGVVTDFGVEVGEWVSRGAWVARLADLDTIEIRLELPEQYFRHVRREAEAPVTVDAYPGLTLDGSVFSVVPRADSEARSFPVVVRAANPQGKIGAGMLARVRLTLDTSEAVMTVPKDAIVRQAQREMLWVIEGDVARAVAVRTGRGSGDRVEVIGELAVGDRVVIRGNERLSPGQPVILQAHDGG